MLQKWKLWQRSCLENNSAGAQSWMAEGGMLFMENAFSVAQDRSKHEFI